MEFLWKNYLAALVFACCRIPSESKVSLGHSCSRCWVSGDSSCCCLLVGHWPDWIILTTLLISRSCLWARWIPLGRTWGSLERQEYLKSRSSREGLSVKLVGPGAQLIKWQSSRYLGLFLYSPPWWHSGQCISIQIVFLAGIRWWNCQPVHQSSGGPSHLA